MPVLQKNQTITLEINGYTAEGAGVGHFEGMAVFVPGTLRGKRYSAISSNAPNDMPWENCEIS